jgi:predicted outer membrane repeat protein
LDAGLCRVLDRFHVTAAAAFVLVGLLFEGLSAGEGSGANYNGYGYGGAVLLRDSSGATATVSGCTFRGNDTDQAGAIYTSSGTTLTVTACLFDANRVGNYGGTIAHGHSSTVTVTACLFDSNHAISMGGAIYFSGATLAITASTFTANTADHYPDSPAVWWYGHSPEDYTNEAADAAFGGGATTG